MLQNLYSIFNGEVFEKRDGHPLTDNRAFYFGDGFFESMRWEKGKVLLEKEHWIRLRKSASLLELDVTMILSEEKLSREINDLALQNTVGDYARIRLSVFRKSAGLYNPEFHHAGYLLDVSALPSSYAISEKGIHAGIYTQQKKAAGKYANIKSLSSQLYVMAALYAHRQGLDDVLIVNTDNNCIESSNSNLLLVHNNTLLTPPLSEGCIDGVFRKFILHVASENNIPFREQIITGKDIAEAEEIWTTSAIRGVTWVAQLADRTYSNAFARSFFEILKSELHRY